MQTNMSTINDANIKTKTPNNNTSKCDVLRKLNYRSNLFKDALNFNNMTIVKV